MKSMYSAKPGICMDTTRWAVDKKLPVRLLYPSVVGEVEPYIKDDPGAENEFISHRAELERPQNLMVIENAFIRDEVGLVELPDGQICYEGNWWLPYLQQHPAYQRRFFAKQRTLKGNWYSFLCLWAAEYYHWFHDVLPRLENAFPHLPKDTRFLINANPRAYQLESLKAYGITAGQLELQPSEVRTKVERLWFATPVGHENLGSGAVLRRVASRLLCYFAGDNLSGKLWNVYISRRNATCRRVVNEIEIEPVLKEEGFETVLCEELTLAEQVRLFSNTSAIVGPHGGGLTNLIYSLKGSFIGEIHTNDVTYPHYLVMSQQLGMRFGRFKADAVPLVENQVDVRVDAQLFSKWVSTRLDHLNCAKPLPRDH